MGRRQNALVQALLVAVVTYLIATNAELLAIRLFRPTEVELTWISDLLLASALGGVTFLWLHLRDTRLQLTTVERAKVALDTQLSLAAHVQQNLLPQLPADSREMRWAAYLEAALTVGGDFYDCVPVGDRRAVFILGDISGKGIAAAMLLAYVRAVFRTLVRDNLPPVDIVSRLSAALLRDTGGSPYATCIVGRVDLDDASLTFVNAGHPAGLLVRHDDVLQLEPSGPPVGLLPGASYEQTTTALHSSDVAVFVTDGITEGMGEDGNQMARLIAAVRDAGRDPAPQIVCTAVARAARGPGPAGVDGWQDDRTVLVFVVGAVGAHATR